ncbi:LOW QUALITY PROTEIN: hypothetical protein QYF61_027015 [Mycteria americana]|uniref:Rna-directed dna polymerase from mobile element jockey-like n=1 Tax=Mycteria americana TaxID=33587 RepID=A0AAN7NYT0_MYCAM|nr:LOW QUALITY PROTEIN: hypothetical protein QYF61_027015 [Mycteria americana]
MNGLMDEGRAVEVFYLDFNKAFVIICHSILIAKLVRYSLNKWTTLQAENCQHKIQIMSWCPKGLIPVWVMFSVFISDKDNGLECTDTKFLDDTKLREIAIQRDISKVEKWADRNGMNARGLCCQVKELWEEVSRLCSITVDKKEIDWIFSKTLHLQKPELQLY